ncbi:single-stranded DNA-binding protein [Pararhodobacter sp. CCB-MM2]|uniref:single-stranded DNA-binding protein n=1 Tax=Pararhodobacter sp. CCB-MM2 TaxID=1786003 RepID=UPI00082E0D47|nr:single-stranded DNA-binding protein [Pararhodobacter sp. CCB-MM2]
MQTLIIAGNVGKDAVLRRTGSGEPVLNFSIAVDNGKDRDGNKRDSTWFDCALWGKRAESLETYITKGSKLTVQGRPTARAHDGKVYLGINVQELTFMGGGERQGGSDRGSDRRDDDGGSYGSQGGSGGYGSGYGGSDDLNDEVPF